MEVVTILMRTTYVLVSLLVTAGAVVLMRDTAAEENGAAKLAPNDKAIVARGRVVYDDACASCHGTNLEGQADWKRRDAQGYLPAPPHDETGHTWHHSDQVLFELTKYGPGKMAGAGYRTRMPGFEGLLSDTDILAALSYIKSRWPKSVRARHDERNAAIAAQSGVEQ